MDIWQAIAYNISVPAAMLVASAGTDHHHEKSMTMAETIMRPVLVEAKVAQRIYGTKGYLNRYACVGCGGHFESISAYVNSGKRTTCNACSAKRSGRAALTHGQTCGRTSSLQHQRWCGIRQRCYNPGNSGYAGYGGRGIKMCEEWQTFEGFMQWEHFSEIKKGVEIDRIDNNGDYSPSNCRLVTRLENARNRRCTKMSMDVARLIRSYYYSGIPIKVLFSMFGVSRTLIHDIVNFNLWNETYPIGASRHV